jgi:hypothetical protein
VVAAAVTVGETAGVHGSGQEFQPQLAAALNNLSI